MYKKPKFVTLTDPMPDSMRLVGVILPRECDGFVVSWNTWRTFVQRYSCCFDPSKVLEHFVVVLSMVVLIVVRRCYYSAIVEEEEEENAEEEEKEEDCW